METRQIHSIFYFTCVICLYRLIFGTAEKQNLWCHRGKPLTQQYFWALTLFALSRCVHWACCRSVFVTDTHIWKSHWHDKMVFIALNCFFSLYIHFAFLLDSYTVRLRWCASVLWLFTMFHCGTPSSESLSLRWRSMRSDCLIDVSTPCFFCGFMSWSINCQSTSSQFIHQHTRWRMGRGYGQITVTIFKALLLLLSSVVVSLKNLPGIIQCGFSSYATSIENIKIRKYWKKQKAHSSSYK